jgi:hypothetical protein
MKSTPAEFLDSVGYREGFSAAKYGQAPPHHSKYVNLRGQPRPEFFGYRDGALQRWTAKDVQFTPEFIDSFLERTVVADYNNDADRAAFNAGLTLSNPVSVGNVLHPRMITGLRIALPVAYGVEYHADELPSSAQAYELFRQGAKGLDIGGSSHPAFVLGVKLLINRLQSYAPPNLNPYLIAADPNKLHWLADRYPLNQPADILETDADLDVDDGATWSRD